MRRGLVGLVVAACALTACTVETGVRSTQSEKVAAFIDAPIPLDSHTRILTLDNGLTVYLRHNDRPGVSAELRLVINAGSAQESADQAGVAHFLEHMMFNGTHQFPKNELVAVLRGFGMQFGADINAYTSYDETVYELTVPTDDEQNMPTGLDVLAQWLSAATLLETDVTDERGVVLDEWRVREQTFDGRAGDAYQDMYLAGSGYDGRAPIGNDAAIEAMQPAPLRAFYDTWYRPDNAAVMVVGDIDVAEVETMIHERFDGLTARGDTPAHDDIPVGPFTAPVATVVADPDTLAASAMLAFPMQSEPLATSGDIRDRVIVQLAMDMITNRLGDDVLRGDAPLRRATSSGDQIVRSLLAHGVSIDADPAAAADSIDALAVEFERVRRFGFDEVELARAIEFYRSGVQSSYDSRDTVSDGSYVSTMVDHFLTGSPLTDASYDYRTYMAMLESITPADVSDAFVALTTGSAPYLFVTVPDSLGDVPGEADLLALLSGLADRDITPREKSEVVGDTLMARPEPVRETSSKDVRDLSVFVDGTRLEFANGAVVILNTTDIGKDDIAIEARSTGGLALIEPADLAAAKYATDVATGSGLGALDQVQVDTVLAGANVEMHPYISDHWDGFAGSSTAADLELAFQLMHQYIAAPRFEQHVLDVVQAADQPYIDDPLADPDFATYDALIRARYGDDPHYSLLPTAAEAEAITLDTVERTYRSRFANPADWVFVVSGDIDVDAAIDLARRYIGTLEGSAPQENHGALSPEPPTGVVDRTVRAGTGETASLSVLFTEPSSGDASDSVLADLLTQVLTNRLTDHIREALGASYSPYAYTSVDDQPERNVQTYVNVSGAPADMDKVAKEVMADITDLATNGPTATELDDAIAAVQKDYDLFDNDSVANMLLQRERQSARVNAVLDERAKVGSIRLRDLRAFAQRVLPSDHYIQVVQLPE